MFTVLTAERSRTSGDIHRPIRANLTAPAARQPARRRGEEGHPNHTKVVYAEREASIPSPFVLHQAQC